MENSIVKKCANKDTGVPEELKRIHTEDQKNKMVDELRPTFKVLKDKLKSENEQFKGMNLETRKVPNGLDDTETQLKKATAKITEKDREICEAQKRIKSLEVQLQTSDALLEETLKENRRLREESERIALATSERKNQLKRAEEQLDTFLPIVQDYEKIKKLKDQLLQFAVNLEHSTEFQCKDKGIETYLEKLEAHIQKNLEIQQQLNNAVLKSKGLRNSSSTSTSSSTQPPLIQLATSTPPSTSCYEKTLPEPEQRQQKQIKTGEHCVVHSEHGDQQKGMMELIEEQLAIIDNIHEQQNKLLEFAENIKDLSKFECLVAGSSIVNHLEELEAHLRNKFTSPPTVIYNTIEKFLRERQLASYISLRPETLPSTSHARPQSTAAQMSVSSTSFTRVASPLSTNNSPVELCSPQSITEHQQNAISFPSMAILPQPLSPNTHTQRNPRRITKMTSHHHGKNVRQRRTLRRKGIAPSDASFQCKCGKAFTTKLTLKSHMAQCVSEKSFKCEVCQRQFSRVGDLKRHLNKAHPKDVILNALETECECQSCGDRFATLELYIVHICNKRVQPNIDQSINDGMQSKDSPSHPKYHCSDGNAFTKDVHIVRTSSDNFNVPPAADELTDKEFVDFEH